MTNKYLEEMFSKIFGGRPDGVYFAPGRVNLIGEHTDYNGGHVFPCALTMGTYAAVRKRYDRKLCFFSANYKTADIIESTLDDLHPQKQAGWTNYPKGVVWAFREKGFVPDSGFDILFWGDIPEGCGLSSSSSIGVLMGYILIEMFGFNVTKTELALLAQAAENGYNGVQCGIMDQFVISMGKKGHAIYLNTVNLEYEYVPLNLDKVKIVIASTNKKRKLEDSKYNERRAQCEAALKDIKRVKNILTLGELSYEEFSELESVISDPTNKKRARHAVSENERTMRAVKAIKENDFQLFGKLMNESHVSLRDDYEVTGAELDTLAEEAWKVDGVLGSRMTGAGFGGCTVSLVRENVLDEFTGVLGSVYKDKFGYSADFYTVSAGAGPEKL